MRHAQQRALHSQCRQHPGLHPDAHAGSPTEKALTPQGTQLVAEKLFSGTRLYTGTYISVKMSTVTTKGGDLVSTWIAKPEVHAEVQETSLIHLQNL